MRGSKANSGLGFGQGGDMAQQQGQRESQQQDGGNGDQQPGQQRVADDAGQLRQQAGGRRVQQGGDLHGANGAGVKKPSPKPDKRHNEQELQRHGDIVGRLNSGKIEPQGQIGR